MTESYATSMHIAASPDEVFDHFVKPELLVMWMGQYARLDAAAGGEFYVDVSGVLIRGQFLTVERPKLIEVTWGEAGSAIMPPGTTHLRIQLTATDDGTTLRLTHSGLAASEAEKHAIGWPHYLGRLGVLAGGGDPGRDPWASPQADEA